MEPHFRSAKSGLNRLSCVRQKQPFQPQLGVSKIQYEADPAHQWKCPEKFKHRVKLQLSSSTNIFRALSLALSSYVGRSYVMWVAM